MSKKVQSPKEYKLSKKLGPEIRSYYEKEIGVPIPGQNYLELFTPDVINDLFTIMDNNSDNQLKADYVTDFLKPLGFTEKGGGLGTNIMVVTHPVYPGVVFKIALDRNGIADNFNDYTFSKQLPRYAKFFMRDATGIVSVQERYYVMNSHLMQLYKDEVLRYLNELKDFYLVADLSIKNFRNYGVARDGNFVIIDGSDVYPLSQMEKDPFKCRSVVDYRKGKKKFCKGRLHYTEDFSQVICEKCGKTYIPIELRPRRELNSLFNVLSDGTTAKHRKELERIQLEWIQKRYPEDFPEEVLEDTETETKSEIEIEIEQTPLEDFSETMEVSTKKNSWTPPSEEDDFWRLEKKEDLKPNVGEGYDLAKELIPKVTNKKSKKIVHGDPVTVTIHKDGNESSEVVEEPNDTEVSKTFKDRLLLMKSRYPDGFKSYVKELIDIIGEGYIIDLLPKDESAPETEIEATEEEIDDVAKTSLKSKTGDYIEYEVVPMEDTESDQLPGIFIRFHSDNADGIPDFNTVYQQYALPIYLIMGEGTNETVNLIMTVDQLKMDVEEAFQEIIQDIKTLNRYNDSDVAFVEEEEDTSTEDMSEEELAQANELIEYWKTHTPHPIEDEGPIIPEDMEDLVTRDNRDEYFDGDSPEEDEEYDE